MPELSSRGDIFTVEKEKELGTKLNGQASFKSELSYDARFKAGCHGLSVGLASELNVIGRLQGALSIIEAELAAKAEAEASVAIDMQVLPEVYDCFGFVAQLLAYAEASVALGLKIGLATEEIVRLTTDDLDDFETKVFMLFAQHVVAEAGAWGRASVAAAARANLNIVGKLSGDDPGFDIKFGAGAGFKVGTGVDFFAALRFKELIDFFDSLTDLLIDEVIGVRHTPSPTPTPEELADFVFRFYYKFFFRLALTEIKSHTDMGKIAFKVLQKELKTYVAPKIIMASRAEAIKTLDALPPTVQQQSNVINLRNELVSDDLELKHLDRLLKQVIDTARDANENAAADDLVAFGAYYWCAATILNEATPVNLPKPPDEILDYIANILNRPSISSLSLAFAGLFFVEVGVDHLVTFHPDIEDFFDGVEDVLPIGTGTVTVAIILLSVATFNETVRAFALDKLEDAGKSATESVDDWITNEESTEEWRIYAEHAIVPTLKMMVNVLMNWVRQPLLSDTEHQKLREALGQVLYRFMSRNIVVLSDVILHQTIMNFSRSFIELAQAADDDVLQDLMREFNDMVQEWFNIPEHVLLLPENSQAVAHLLSDIFELGAIMFAPSIWNDGESEDHRRNARRDAMAAMFDSFFNWDDFDDEQEVERALEKIKNCERIPNEEAIQKLVNQFAVILDEEFDILIEHVPRIVITFWENINEERFNQAIDTVMDVVEDIQQLLDEARQRLREVEQELRRLHRQLAQIEDDIRDKIQDILIAVRSNRIRNQVNSILDSIYNRGIEKIEQMNIGRLRKQSKKTKLFAVFTGIKTLARTKLLGLDLQIDLQLNPSALRNKAQSSANLETFIEDEIKATLRSEIEAWGIFPIKVRNEIIISVDDVIEAILRVLYTNAIRTYASELYELFQDEQNRRNDISTEETKRRDKTQDVQDLSQRLSKLRVDMPLRIEVYQPESDYNAIDVSQWSEHLNLDIFFFGMTQHHIESNGEHILILLDNRPILIKPHEWRVQHNGLRLKSNYRLKHLNISSGLHILTLFATDGFGNVAQEIVPVMIKDEGDIGLQLGDSFERPLSIRELITARHSDSTTLSLRSIFKSLE